MTASIIQPTSKARSCEGRDPYRHTLKNKTPKFQLLGRLEVAQTPTTLTALPVATTSFISSWRKSNQVTNELVNEQPSASHGR